MLSNHVTLELSPHQVETLVERLPLQDKIRLVRKLENETWAKRLDSVVQRIRCKVRAAGISDKKIERLCEDVKKEYDEKHRHH